MAPVPIPVPDPPRSLRYPSIALPPYRYVPGLQPHPWRDPKGHHHQDTLPSMDRLWWPERDWAAHPHFVHACDLFDHRFVWEAHEVWESIWHAIPKEHPDRDRVQLLIQAAACCLKIHTQHWVPARALLQRCDERQHRFAIEFVDTRKLVIDLRAFMNGGAWPLLASNPCTARD